VHDFLSRMRDSHEWLNDKGREREAAAVARVLNFRREAASAAYRVTMNLENIEELFSLASASRGEMDKHIRLAIAGTLDSARIEKMGKMRMRMRVQGDSSVFRDKDQVDKGLHPKWVEFAGPEPHTGHPQGEAGPYFIDLYAFYAARLLGMFLNGSPKGQSTFITFNYDMLLENALTRLHLPYNYGFATGSVTWHGNAVRHMHPRGIGVFKLHGSVNWARKNSRSKSLVIFDDYRDVLETDLVPELVPPTWKKVFENQLESVWESAVQSLSTATRIVIVGFSMPPADVHFKHLMAAGLQQNISLRQILFVNPEGEHGLRQRTNAVFKQAPIQYAEKRLSEYVDSSNWAGMEEIGRPFEVCGVSLSHSKG